MFLLLLRNSPCCTAARSPLRRALSRSIIWIVTAHDLRGGCDSEEAELQEADRPFRKDDLTGGPPPVADGKSGSAEQRPLWERITTISRRIPHEEWAKLPDDASYQLDHYLFGAPKR